MTRCRYEEASCSADLLFDRRLMIATSAPIRALLASHIATENRVPKRRAKELIGCSCGGREAGFGHTVECSASNGKKGSERNGEDVLLYAIW